MQSTAHKTTALLAAFGGLIVTYAASAAVLALTIAAGQDVRFDFALWLTLGCSLLPWALYARNSASRARASLARGDQDVNAPMRRRANELSQEEWEALRSTQSLGDDHGHRKMAPVAYPAHWPPHGAAFPGDDDPARTGKLIHEAMDKAEQARAMSARMGGGAAIADLDALQITADEIKPGGLLQCEEFDPFEYEFVEVPARAAYHHAPTAQTAPLILVCAARQALGGPAMEIDGFRLMAAAEGDWARAAAAYALPRDAEPRQARMRKHNGRPAFWTLDPALWAPPESRLDELALSAALVLIEMEAMIEEGRAGRDLDCELAELGAPAVEQAAQYLGKFFPSGEESLAQEMAAELDDMLGAAIADPDGISPKSWHTIGRVWRDFCMELGIKQATYAHRAPEAWDPPPSDDDGEAE